MLKVLLISGWGMGVEPLAGLQQQLNAMGCLSDVIPIFDALDPTVFDQQLEQVPHYDALIGWSLGGQLATLLAQRYWEQTGIAKKLITLASNPCFVQQPDWPWAMSATDFQHFKQSFDLAPSACIKRFCYLLTQGGDHAKENWRSLQNLQIPQEERLQKQGLNLLQELNLVSMLKNYPGRQLHVLAMQDALVDYNIAFNLAELPAKLLSVIEIEGTHSFPVFQIEETSHIILTFMR